MLRTSQRVSAPTTTSRHLPGAYREGGDHDYNDIEEDDTTVPMEDNNVSIVQSSLGTTQLVSARLVTEPVVAAIHLPPEQPKQDEGKGWMSQHWKLTTALVLLVILAAGLVIGLLVLPDSGKNDLSPTWTQLGRTIHGEAEGDYSGHSVSLSYNGTIVAIGAPKNEGLEGEDTGHVRVYKYTEDGWRRLGEDIEGGPESEWLGGSVSLSADGLTLAVGDMMGGCCGQLRVYNWFNDTLWTQVGQVVNGSVENEDFGRSVSLSADGMAVAVGAWGADLARVYRLVSGVWTQIGQDMTGEGSYGQSVSLSADGTVVAVGEPYRSFAESGAVHVYRLIGQSWFQIGLTFEGKDGEGTLGYSVSLSGNGTIIAYSTGDRVLVFSLQDDDFWSQIGHDIEQGGLIALSPDGSTVACKEEDTLGVFAFVDEAWALLGEEFDGVHAGWDERDRPISLSENGTIVAFGTNPRSDGGGAGAVHVYGLT